MANTLLKNALGVNAATVNVLQSFQNFVVAKATAITASDGNNLDMTAGTISFTLNCLSGGFEYLATPVVAAISGLTPAQMLTNGVTVDNTVAGQLTIAFAPEFSNTLITGLGTAPGTISFVLQALDSTGGNNLIVCTGTINVLRNAISG